MQQLLEQTAISVSLPPPVGGWNARDPLESMQPQDAIRLINVFPDTRAVKLRKGYESHATGMGSAAIETLAEHITAAGTKTLVAATGGKIYDATSAGAATQKGTGFSEDQWQTQMFRHTMIFVNGTDTPQQYDGTTLSTATYTGTGLTATDLISVTAYRNRLYFAEKDTASIWYGGTNNITGALTEFDLSSLLNGHVVAITPWTFTTGSGVDEHLVILSSAGEGLVYSGPDPSDSAWSLVGRFVIPEPLGRRCIVQLGTETIVITEIGLIPLRRELFVTGNESSYARISDKIDNAFREAGASYGSNFGWHGISYPNGPYALFNVPVAENATTYQFVVNLITGAWCEFRGMNGSAWAIHKNKPYFGGVDGVVYKADTGQADNGTNICVDMKTAFSFFGNRQQNKLLHFARPIMDADSNVEFTFGVDVDFEENFLANAVSVSGATGTSWGSAWGSSWSSGAINSKDWYSVAGLGRSVSLKLKGDYQDVSFSISSFDVQYTAGGTL